MATSQADTTKSATAAVTVDAPAAADSNVSVSISPTSATVPSASTQQFTAKVSGSTNTAVTWTTNDGSISASGLYTAPTVTANTTAIITATSQANTAESASATVTVDTTSAAKQVNVQSYGATGDGTTDDTSAIQSAIAALTSGATLVFPAGTYKVTGVLTINVPNVAIDGSNNTATISMQSSSGSLRFGACSGISCSLTNGVALAATANELATSFTTDDSFGASAGSYIFINQGGEDSSDGSDDLGCDVSGCRGEVLQVASVSGNTITVTTALHDTYVPTSGGTMSGEFSSGCNLSSGSGNCATAWLVKSPLTGITLQNITIDGTNVATLPIGLYGVANSTISNVTIERTNTPSGNGTYSLLANVTYGLTFTNVTLTSGTALAEMGVYQHGNLTINGMTISGSAGGAAYLSAGANDSVTNMTINDAGNTTSRPFKTTATRHSTFNGLTVENGSGSLNGISLEYYSSHNTFSGCVVQNNAGGNGSAGINSFGNFNQYNTFSNCTVSGNGNVQIYISDADALGLAQDSNDAFISNTIGGSGTPGLLIFGANACVNNNVFQSGLGAGIEAEGSGTMGSGNVMNGDSSNLTTGTCTAP
jgi:hypothetical protein